MVEFFSLRTVKITTWKYDAKFTFFIKITLEIDTLSEPNKLDQHSPEMGHFFF